MSSQVNLPIYQKVALDLASRIIKGELKEGDKIKGRSLVSTQYNVSPETIRRAIKVLSDMEIVEILQNSGAIIKSREHAVLFVEKYNNKSDIANLKQELKKLLFERDQFNERIIEITNEIVDLSERFKKIDPVCGIEFIIKQECKLLNKSIKECAFRNVTGATIIAIRRDQELILSPSPDDIFLPDDIIVIVGDSKAVSKVGEYLE